MPQRSIDLMDQKREVRQKTLSRNYFPEDKYLYKMLNTEIQRNVRKLKPCCASRNAAYQNRMKDVYEITMSISGKVHKSGSHIRDNNVSILITNEDILNRRVEHFTELPNVPVPKEESEILPSLVIDC